MTYGMPIIHKDYFLQQVEEQNQEYHLTHAHLEKDC